MESVFARAGKKWQTFIAAAAAVHLQVEAPGLLDFLELKIRMKFGGSLQNMKKKSYLKVVAAG